MGYKKNKYFAPTLKRWQKPKLALRSPSDAPSTVPRCDSKRIRA